MKFKDNDWNGWKEDPCSDESSAFLTLLQERLEWATSLDKMINSGGSYGHSGNVVEALNRNEKIKKLRTIINDLLLARKTNGC